MTAWSISQHDLHNMFMCPPNAMPLSRERHSRHFRIAHSIPPLVGCSDMLGRPLLASHPVVAGTTPKIHHSQNANLVTGCGVPVRKALAQSPPDAAEDHHAGFRVFRDADVRRRTSARKAAPNPDCSCSKY